MGHNRQAFLAVICLLVVELVLALAAEYVISRIEKKKATSSQSPSERGTL